MTRDDFDALGVELMAADEAGEPGRLAAIAWRLYAEAGIAQAAIERLHSVLHSRNRVPGSRSAPTQSDQRPQ